MKNYSHFLLELSLLLSSFFGVRQLEKASGMAGADTLTIYNWGLYRSGLD